MNAALIVKSLFGDCYLMSVVILQISIWSIVFLSISIASTLWIMPNQLYKFQLIRNLCGCCMNFGLNILLIPRFSGAGAAVASLISYFVVSYLFFLINPLMRKNFILITNGVLRPRF